MNAPFVARSLTLVPRSLLLNRTETLANKSRLSMSHLWTLSVDLDSGFQSLERGF